MANSCHHLDVSGEPEVSSKKHNPLSPIFVLKQSNFRERFTLNCENINIFHGIMADVFVLNRQQPCWCVKFKSLGNHANILFLFLLTERMIFHDSHIMWKAIIDNKTKIMQVN